MSGTPDMFGSAKKLAVIVPAYNEEGHIEEALLGLKNMRPSLSRHKINLEIFVIDDGSTDQTNALARQAKINRVICHPANQGLGAAVRTGLKAAQESGADFACKIDADLQHDAEDILPLLEPLLAGRADIVYGNRFEKIDYRMPFVRYMGNRVFTGLMRWLTPWPLQDSQPGIFTVNRSYLGVFKIQGDYNYTQQILLDAYHKGMRFEHVPVSFHKRNKGKSFVSMKYPLTVIGQIMMTLVELKPLKVFGPIGCLFLGISALIAGYELVQWFQGYAAKPIIHVNAVLGFGLFGLQTLFFGILAQLIVSLHRK